jgi:hypothetical protein
MRPSRRDIDLALIIAALGWIPQAFADFDTDTEGGGGGVGGSSGTDNSGNTEEQAPPDDGWINSSDWIATNDPLGLTCRAPTLAGDTMTLLQMMATDTTEPASYLGVQAGDFASDESNRQFQQGYRSYLDEAIQKLQEASSYLVEEVRDGVDYIVNGAFASAGNQEPSFWTDKWFNFDVNVAVGTPNQELQVNGTHLDSLSVTGWIPIAGEGGVYGTASTAGDSGVGIYFGVSPEVSAFVQTQLSDTAPNVQFGVNAGVGEISVDINAAPMIESGGRALENIERNMYDYTQMMDQFWR